MEKHRFEIVHASEEVWRSVAAACAAAGIGLAHVVLADETLMGEISSTSMGKLELGATFLKVSGRPTEDITLWPA